MVANTFFGRSLTVMILLKPVIAMHQDLNLVCTMYVHTNFDVIFIMLFFLLLGSLVRNLLDNSIQKLSNLIDF